MTLSSFLSASQDLFFGYFLLLAVGNLLLYFVARTQFVERSLTEALQVPTGPESAWPPITVVLPAYNEEAVIVAAVDAALNLGYPGLQVVAVCDGSKDATLERLIRRFSLERVSRELSAGIKTQPILQAWGSPAYPSLTVIDKLNGGKADALNAGINAAGTPLVCCCDADTLIERGALQLLALPFTERPTAATAGSVEPYNGLRPLPGGRFRRGSPPNWLARMQLVEYARAFYFARMGLDPLHSMLLISGAFGLFDRNIAVEVGGYSVTALGEDLEFVMRIHQHLRVKARPYRIKFVPTAVAWTEVPEDLASLKSQRIRWHRGLLESLWRHRSMPFAAHAGPPGVIGYGYYWVFEAIAPVVEALGYLYFAIVFALGIRNWLFWGALAALAASTGVFLTQAALEIHQRYRALTLTHRDLAVLQWASILELVAYRPLTLWWRLTAVAQALLGRKAVWGSLPRKGAVSS